MRIAVDALAWLANADVASVPVSVQAECLRECERVASVHTAAQAAVLSAFDAVAWYEGDAARSPRTWLKWQTQVTGAAASASVGWMRRLRAHRAVAGALAAGLVSASWAREICDWTDRLPADAGGSADQVLLAAAAGGAGLADLARLAEEMRRRLAEPDHDDDGGSDDRQLRLQVTLGGAGRLDGGPGAPGAPALSGLSSVPWARRPGRRTPGPGGSVAMMCWRKPAGAWSPFWSGQPCGYRRRLPVSPRMWRDVPLVMSRPVWTGARFARPARR